jgi:hypothetical protein
MHGYGGSGPPLMLHQQVATRQADYTAPAQHLHMSTCTDGDCLCDCHVQLAQQPGLQGAAPK